VRVRGGLQMLSWINESKAMDVRFNFCCLLVGWVAMGGLTGKAEEDNGELRVHVVLTGKYTR